MNGRIRFDSSDRLCLDGQRLVLVNRPLNDANYWAPGAEFRTDIDQFARITSQGSGAADLSFTVENRDGLVMTSGPGAYERPSLRSIYSTVPERGSVD